jgi:hypothetical protein
MKVPKLQLKLLEKGQVFAWNEWRRAHETETLEFSDLTLAGMSLNGIDLSNARLAGANLSDCGLWGANFSRSNLRGADFQRSTLVEADLVAAELQGANFSSALLDQAGLSNAALAQAQFQSASLRNAFLGGTDLTGANLNSADLSGASLEGARLISTDLTGATIDSCRVYGMSAWDVKLDRTIQRELIVTSKGEPSLVIDNLELAQFVYLLLRREKLRGAIETLTTRTVLILGRFTPERKVILDALGDEVRANGLVPMIFDFERAATRDLTETVRILAGLSLFVIADISNPKSSPLELQATVPDYEVPFTVILQEGEQPFAMYGDLSKYDWVLQPVLSYRSSEALRKAFKPALLDRAWEMHKRLVARRASAMTPQSIEDFLERA